MNKEELVKEIAERSEISQKIVKTVLDSTIEVISDTLSKGDIDIEERKITLVGFGTFKVKKYKAREGRNPQDGKPIKIPEKLVPVFSAGKILKEKVASAKAVAKKGKK